MRDRLKHVRLWTEGTSSISFNERLEVGIWIICADKGRRSVYRRLVTLAEVGNRTVILEEDLKMRQVELRIANGP